MESYDPAGDEPRDKVTSGGKVHIQDNDNEKEFLDDKRHCFNDENLLQSVVISGGANCSRGDVMSSSTLHTSTDVSDNMTLKEMSSSQCAAELGEDCDVTNHTPSTIIKGVNIDVISDATRSSYDHKDEAEYIAGETTEERRDELRDGTEHGSRNGVKEKAKGEAIEEARDEAMDIIRDEAKGEATEMVRDEAKSEAIEEVRDEAKDIAREAIKEDRDEINDIVRDESKDEAILEVRDEAKDIARGEAKGEAIEEARDGSKNVVRDKAKSEVIEEARDEAKDIAREVYEEARNETNIIARDEAKGEAILEARDEVKDIVRDEAKGEAIEEARDETKDITRCEAKGEAIEEARDETKDITRYEAKGEAIEEVIDEAKGIVRKANEEARDETKDISSHEAYDGAWDEAKGGTRILTSDGTRDEVRDGIRSGVSNEAWNEAGNPDVSEILIKEDDAAISIEEDMWRYIMKTKEWTRRISHVLEGLNVEIKEIVSDDRLGLKFIGINRLNVVRAEREFLDLVLECKDVVRTIEVPCLDNHVHFKVVRLLKSINKLPCYVSAAPELIRVTGRSEEIGSCLEKLETYGVRYESERKAVTTEKRDEAKDVARDEAKGEAIEEVRDEAKGIVRKANEEARDETKDISSREAYDGAWDEAKDGTRILTSDGNRDEGRDGIRCGVSNEAGNEAGDPNVDQNEDDAAISIEEDIWRYIMKTKEWTRRISLVMEGLNVEIKEIVSDGRLRLKFIGIDRLNRDRAEREVLDLVFECQDVVHTIEIPCQDNHVHSKIVRLLKSINKLPCYVSAAPELIRVTGTNEEIGSCLEKLESYGVRYESERKDVTIEKRDFPEQQTPLEKPASATLDNSRLESLSRQLPVPIEKHLWHFIQQKRKSDLRGFEESFGVTISTKPTNDVATIAVSISMLSSDNTQILNLAEEALSQLFARLGDQVVVQCISGGEGVAKMPPEVLNSLQQNLAGIDVILEIIESRSGRNPGHRLLIVGPEKELALNKQVIKRAIENVACPNVPPSVFDDPEACNEMSDANQKFPGIGNRLGSKTSKSHEKVGQSKRDNASRVDAGRTTATGGPSFRDHSSESKVTAEMSASRQSASEGLVEPKSSKETPLRVPASSLGQPQEAETSADRSDVGQKSPKQKAASSLTKDTTPKQKQVTFADSVDGIRVYPSEPSPPYSRDSVDIGKPDTNCPEPKGGSSQKNKVTGSRSGTDTADTTAGRLSLCSTCKDVPEAQRVSGCTHVFCMACVMDHMVDAAAGCPVCGNSERPKVAPTQPIGGQMLVTHNNASRLPGFENNSKGIIIVTYVFKQGYQTADDPSPGQHYPGLTKTTFLPLSPIGNEVLDLLQKAFEARLTFRIALSPSHPSGELVWNEILHKENIFGGPKEGGYPDPVYMERVRQDLLDKGIH